MNARKARRAGWAAAKQRQRAKAKAHKLARLREQFLRTIRFVIGDGRHEAIFENVSNAQVTLDRDVQPRSRAARVGEPGAAVERWLEEHRRGPITATFEFTALDDFPLGDLPEVVRVRAWVGDKPALDGMFRLTRITREGAPGDLLTTTVTGRSVGKPWINP